MTDHHLVPEPARPPGTPGSRGSLSGVTYDARPANDLDDFDVRGALHQLLACIRGHKLLILLCGLASAGLMQAYFKLYPPVYEAKVMVLAESDKDVVREEYYKLWSTFRKNDLDSDIELATAFPVVRKVVEKLKLSYDDVYHPPLEHTLYLWEQSWIGNQYRRIKEWFFPKEPNPYALSPGMKELARTVRDFRAGASLTPIPGTHVGNLIVQGPSPRVAEYANTLIDEFIADRRRQFAEEARESYKSLGQEVEKARQGLIRSQRAIEEFETRNALLLGFQKDEVLMGQWVELGLGLAKLEAQLSSQRQAMEVVTAELTKEPEELELSSTVQASGVKEQMRAHLFELNNNLRQTLTRMHEDSPEVRELKALIAETRAAIDAEPDERKHATTRAKNENHLRLRQTRQDLLKSMAGTEAELATRRGTYAKIGAQLAALPKLKAESALLQQDLNTSGTRHKLLRERLMMAEVSLATALSAPSTFKIIDYSLPPAKPVWPKEKLFMMVAILVGVLTGIGLGLFLDMISNVVTRDRLALRQDLPVFGTIEIDDSSRAGSALGYSHSHPAPQRAIDRLRGS
ncbi:MAG: hypothetical protein HYX63_09610 [Gammaproteobacteria bacterium]|nr:hypothetical protein [Gammaproteobacteria bacterium]